MEYRGRLIDITISERLESKGALLIEGPKWCGKSTTGLHHANSKLLLSREDTLLATAQLLQIDTPRALIGEPPLLIDEWQELPSIWDAVRYEVDERNEPGQFILTGSAVPNIKDAQPRHSGAGRFAWIKMRTMSLFESGESSGTVSIQALFNNTLGNGIFDALDTDLDKLAFLISRGGWPKAVDLNGAQALEQAYDYTDAIVREDVTRTDGVKRASERIQRTLRAYARHQGSQTPIRTLRDDIKPSQVSTLDEETVAKDLEALRKIFVIEDMEAWNPNLRSKAAIRTSPTRYFTDPSIAVAALGLGPKDLLNDLETLGLLFETMVVRDLRIYAESLKGQVYHYRDSDGLECDAVIHLRNGDYGLVEVKLGGQKWIDAGAANLIKLENKIDTDSMKSPSFKMIVTGVGTYAYKRPDGILVAPLSSLRN